MADDLGSEILRPRSGSGLAFKQLVDAYERDLISEAMRQANGVQKTAAELLKLKPTTLNEKIKRLGLR